MNERIPEPESRPTSPGTPERPTSPGTPEPGGVPPEETPPAEGGLSGAGPRETYNPAKGWGAGPIIAVMAVVVLFAVFFVVGWLTR
ncbi:DUF6480 family protein [Streptomyces pathocidini]|uniref:DUF6480 family protein n=1 Tax=Streptomyces pathocidini TaxID=1650571 RepID=UPI0033CF9F5A